MTSSSTITVDVNAIKSAIRNIPDFPKPGILFKDITTVLREPELFAQTIEYFAQSLNGQKIDFIVGIESRGFILGAPLAVRLGAGFVPVRKKGKLPGSVQSHEYELEYGTDTVEIHDDSLEKGANVLIVDDLIATGGTAAAAGKLVQALGANLVGYQFMIELSALQGKSLLPESPYYNSMIQF